MPISLFDIQHIKKKRDTHHGLKNQMVRNPFLIVSINEENKRCKYKFMF